MKPIIQFFSSLKLTVVLLSFSLALIFFGTLDQVQYGIWHAQKLYFESFFVVWAYPSHAPGGEIFHWLRIPLPGGYLLGGMLLANLLAAHITRFKLTLKKSGLFMIHFGLILLLVSELLTDLVAEESMMSIDENDSINYSVDNRSDELVFINRSHPDYDEVHKIPEHLLTPGQRVSVPDTNLSIETVQFMENAQLLLLEGNPNFEAIADSGAAARMGIFAREIDESFDDQVLNATTAYITVFEGERALGTWLVSNLLDDRYPPQMIRTSEGEWEMALRFERTYYPFRMHLNDFAHDKYPGTEIPYNFSSDVRVEHQDSTLNKKALIYMNHPLRFEGLTFYQASFLNDDMTSVLQVVRNPGWVLPYVSVALMFFGMFIQFGMHFVKFLSKEPKAPR